MTKRGAESSASPAGRRSTYLYHVVDSEWSMREYGAQGVVWQTAVNPIFALELIADGTWTEVGVLGPEAFDAILFLDPLTDGYQSPWASGSSQNPLEATHTVGDVDVTQLLASVEREFATTGAATPPWPDPHPNGQSPREDEYSHTLDPAKYRIVGARAEAWARALESSGLAMRESVRDIRVAWRPSGERSFWHPEDRGEWLRPRLDGGVALLFVLGSIGAPDNHLEIGAGDPAASIKNVPFCGCDACDSGSEHLLDEIDEAVVSVVSGAFVYLTLGATEVRGWANGWSAAGGRGDLADRHEIADAIAQVRAGRARAGALHGPAWWS